MKTKLNRDLKYCLIFTIFVVSFLFINYIPLFAEEKLQKQQNATLVSTNFNFIAAGDWYCNKETEKTIQNILTVHPELIITTGDHVKDENSAKCWMKMSKPIHDKMKIAIGNHDIEYKNIYKQIVDYHHLKNPYYSHNFKNIHFISLSTEHPFEKGSKQYEFVENDLKKASNTSSIDWIIVHNHKPYYSTRNDMDIAEELRNTYHPLFETYGVDLVISSHNQYYERTYPLMYNSKNDGQPIYSNSTASNYHNPHGIIFLTVGTAGDELQDIENKDDYYVIQKERYGFLNLELKGDGHTIMGEFHTNKGKILDNFELTKS